MTMAFRVLCEPARIDPTFFRPLASNYPGIAYRHEHEILRVPCVSPQTYTRIECAEGSDRC